MSRRAALPPLSLAGAIGIGGVLFGANTIAQTEAPVERVEITGSHILQTEKEGAAPVQVITAEDIRKSGQPTVADLLRTVTANSGNSYNEGFSNSFAPGAAGISLRGLSPKNTLVLLNGQRVANFGFAQNIQDTFVDIDAIPANAVDRIEILKDGASAVYGSEAIAGVVNIILRRDYQGAAAGASIDQPTEGGFHQYDANMLYGHGDLTSDKYNVMLAASWFKTTQLLASDRSWSAGEDYRNLGGNFAWANGATYRTSNIPGHSRTPFPGCGTVFPGKIVTGATLGPPNNPVNTYCYYDPASYFPLMPASEREQAVANGTLQLTPEFTAFTNFLYSHNKTDQTFTPAFISPGSVAFDPATGGVQSVSNVLPANNPSNPFGRPVGVNYTFFSVGPRDATITTDFYRVLGGLKGSVGDWNWQVTGGYSESTASQQNYNSIDVPNLISDIANGSFNFLDPASTPAALNGLRIGFKDDSTSKLEFGNVNVSSEILQLAAGPLGFAAGADFRHESIANLPDPSLLSGLILNFGQTTVHGARTEYAGYMEFSAPLLKTLEAQLAGRYDHYSDFGSEGTPKVGLRFQPAPEVLARGSFSKGFRAPSLPEITPSSATFFLAVVDPVTGTNSNVAGVQHSNPKLKPERSTNLNLGLVLSPTPAVSVSLDWYRIIQHDLVQANSFQYIVDNASQFPGAVVRDSAGNIVSVTSPYENISFLDTSGFDFNVKWRFATDVGVVKVSSDVTYLAKYQEPIAVGTPAIEMAGTNNLQNIYSGGALPRWRSVLSLDLERGPWTGRITNNYISGYFQVVSPDAQTEVNDWSSFDLYGEYRGFKGWRLYGSVLNLLNQRPPFDAFMARFFTTPYDFTLYDGRDRVVRVGFEYKFL